jgi:hypothetical protein
VIDLATVTAADFAALEVREFTRVVAAGEPPVSLTRTEVRPGRPRDGARDPFSLTFTGPADITLLQGIHPLRHPELGEVELFLTPVGQAAQDLAYEAVFG